MSLAGEGDKEFASSDRGVGVSRTGESVPDGDVDGPSSSSSAMISVNVMLVYNSNCKTIMLRTFSVDFWVSSEALLHALEFLHALDPFWFCFAVNET